MTKQKQKSMARVLSCLAAVVLAVAVFVTAGSWLRASNVYAAPSQNPDLITLTYYDGPYHIGWTWQTTTGVTGGKVQFVEKTAGMTKSSVTWEGAQEKAAVSTSVSYGNVTSL